MYGVVASTTMHMEISKCSHELANDTRGWGSLLFKSELSTNCCADHTELEGSSFQRERRWTRVCMNS